MAYKIVYNNTILGPMSEDQIFAYAVDENTQVAKDEGRWQPLYSCPELMSRLVEKRRMTSSVDRDADSKKTLCGIMAILLGGFGVQYFILGKVKGGLLSILLTFVTCGVWSILTLIQGIMMLTMSDEEFRRKYIDSTSFMPLF